MKLQESSRKRVYRNYQKGVILDRNYYLQILCHVCQTVRHSNTYNVTVILLIIGAKYSVRKYYQFICGLNS